MNTRSVMVQSKSMLYWPSACVGAIVLPIRARQHLHSYNNMYKQKAEKLCKILLSDQGKPEINSYYYVLGTLKT
jgi:hypothetical protein